MMISALVLTALSVRLLIKLIPGPTMALIMMRSAKNGWVGGVAAALGVCLGEIALILGATTLFSVFAAQLDLMGYWIRWLAAGYFLHLAMKAWIGHSTSPRPRSNAAIHVAPTLRMLSERSADHRLSVIEGSACRRLAMLDPSLFDDVIGTAKSTAPTRNDPSFAGPINPTSSATPFGSKRVVSSAMQGLMVALCNPASLLFYVALAGQIFDFSSSSPVAGIWHLPLFAIATLAVDLLLVVAVILLIQTHNTALKGPLMSRLSVFALSAVALITAPIEIGIVDAAALMNNVFAFG